MAATKAELTVDSKVDETAVSTDTLWVDQWVQSLVASLAAKMAVELVQMKADPKVGKME